DKERASRSVIANASQLRELLPQLQSVDRVALDTEADSLHCYREKLCLLQISIPTRDAIVDPLTDIDLAPLRDSLAYKEIVLHGADYDLRLLRRNLSFAPQRIFDTVIAARMIGIREFSLAALVKRYFEIELVKGSQKANWAQRPLSARMAEYAINDTRYLLPLAEKLEIELNSRNRMEWFRQSCQRGLESPEKDWPVRPKRSGTRPTAEVVKKSEQLRHNRDHAAKELHIESSFIAPRATLDAIAADSSRADALLVPWQRELIDVSEVRGQRSEVS